MTLAKAKLIESELGKLTSLLRQNRIEVAWSLADILGFNPKVTMHRLNMDPNVKVVM